MLCFYTEIFHDAFNLWLCELIDDSIPRVKTIRIIKTFNNFNIKVKEHTLIHSGAEINILRECLFLHYYEAFDFASNKMFLHYNHMQQRRLSEAKMHFDMYLKLNNTSDINSEIRNAYNETDEMRKDISWGTPVYRYCFVGNKELCLITDLVELLCPQCEWTGDILKYTYLGKTINFYKTPELARAEFYKENNLG